VPSSPLHNPLQQSDAQAKLVAIATPRGSRHNDGGHRRRPSGGVGVNFGAITASSRATTSSLATSVTIMRGDGDDNASGAGTGGGSTRSHVRTFRRGSDGTESSRPDSPTMSPTPSDAHLLKPLSYKSTDSVGPMPMTPRTRERGMYVTRPFDVPSKQLRLLCLSLFALSISRPLFFLYTRKFLTISIFALHLAVLAAGSMLASSRNASNDRFIS
jgi:hypothetical protein